MSLTNVKKLVNGSTLIYKVVFFHDQSLVLPAAEKGLPLNSSKCRIKKDFFVRFSGSLSHC